MFRKANIGIISVVIISMLLTLFGFGAVSAQESEAGATFYKGININGGPVTIEGNAWLSHEAALAEGFSVSAGVDRYDGSIAFSPQVDEDTNAMINSAIFTWGTDFSVYQTLPNGTYDIYIWASENYRENHRGFDLKLEGIKVATSLGFMPAFTWQKYGPYRISVSDGILTMDIKGITSGSSLSGMAIYTADGSPTEMDDVRPIIDLINPENGAELTSRDVTIKATLYDAASGIDKDTISVNVDGFPVVFNYDSENCMLTAVNEFEDGDHILTIDAKDMAGNSAAQVRASFSVKSANAPNPADFYKGVNFGGDAVTIAGNQWLSYQEALANGLSVTDVSIFTHGGTFSPSVDADTDTMMKTNIYVWGGSFSINQTLPNGTYNVYLWATENYVDNHRGFDLKLEGIKVAASIGYIPAFTWKKYGPYRITVNDGTLNMDIVGLKNGPALAGMAIYTANESPVGTDDLSPVIGLISPESGNVLHSADVIIKATLYDGFSGIDGNTISVKVDGNTVESNYDAVTWTLTAVATLEDGDHTLTIDVKDMAGNSATQLQSVFNLDTSTPYDRISITVNPGERQTFLGFGTSQNNGSSYHLLSSERQEELNQLVWADLNLQVMRLWLSMQYYSPSRDITDMSKFVEHYVSNHMITDAKAHGVTTLLLAPGGIPKYMTTNEDGIHLLDSEVSNYAGLLAKFIKDLKDIHNIQINVTGISNEPNEYITAAQSPLLVKALRQQLDAYGMNSVKIIGMELANVDGYAVNHLNALKGDPEAWNGLAGYATHSYNMAANSSMVTGLKDTGKEYWTTEAGSNGYELPGDSRAGSELAARALNDFNHMVTHWLWFLGFEDYWGHSDDGARLIGYDPNNSEDDWYTVFQKYYYLKQLSNTFDVGAVFRSSTSSLEGDMVWSYGHKPRITAAAAQNPDGTWGVGIVNYTSDAFLNGDGWNQSQRGYAGESFRITVNIPELSGSGTKQFAVYRSNDQDKNLYVETIDVTDGTFEMDVHPLNLITLCEIKPVELTESLTDYVKGLNINKLMKNLLVKKLDDVISALNQEQYKLAIVKLKVFMLEVRVLEPETISKDQAEYIYNVCLDICMAIKEEAQGKDRSWVDNKVEVLIDMFKEFKKASITDTVYDSMIGKMDELIDKMN